MISVILVNHNYGAYIGEAIESVLNQTNQDFELIIVDGASTDNSREIIMSYVEKYSNIITAVFKPTSGQAAAFNVGFQLSRGDVIAFLDADDFFYPNKLERIEEWHKKYEFIGHARKITTPSGKVLEVFSAQDEYEIRPMLLKKYGYVYTYNLIASCISLKRTLAEKIFPMPEKEYMTFADCYVKVLAQYYSNIKYIKEPLSYYRIHNVQKTKSFEDNEKLHKFIINLYHHVFEDINFVLKKEEKPLIPTLTLENLRTAFAIANPNGMIQIGGNYVIYGTGADSVIINYMVTLLGGKFIYAIDSNSEKWGKTWNGITIVSPEEGINKELGYEKIIIGSHYYYKEIKKKLELLGLKEWQDFIHFESIPND